MANGYLLIPDAVSERPDLTASEKLVMAVLARLQGAKSCCYPSYEYVGQKCGMSERQVIRVVNDLVAKEEVIRMRHHRKSNTYSVRWVTARNLRKMWAEKRKAGILGQKESA